jgi:hypothetical protein
MAHEELGLKSTKHKPGCVTRHIGTYIKGNPCSHRWHAAVKARKETRINYTNANRTRSRRWRATIENLAKIANWFHMGKATNVQAVSNGYQSFTVEPFSVVWWPWSNNAHHIIPRSTLAYVLEAASQKGDPNQSTMFSFIVSSLLGEEYNHNEKPNMIMLPNEEEDAARMGLPRHLEGTGAGARDHPDYSDEVFTHTKGKIVPKYDALGSAFAARRHQKKEKAPAIRTDLEGISNTTYDQIIALAQAARAAGQVEVTLDSISSGLFK